MTLGLVRPRWGVSTTAILPIDHPVENSESWKPHFDDHAGVRVERGCEGGQSFHAAGDPTPRGRLAGAGFARERPRRRGRRRPPREMADAGVVVEPDCTSSKPSRPCPGRSTPPAALDVTQTVLSASCRTTPARSTGRSNAGDSRRPATRRWRPRQRPAGLRRRLRTRGLREPSDSILS